MLFLPLKKTHTKKHKKIEKLTKRKKLLKKQEEKTDHHITLTNLSSNKSNFEQLDFFIVKNIGVLRV